MYTLPLTVWLERRVAADLSALRLMSKRVSSAENAMGLINNEQTKEIKLNVKVRSRTFSNSGFLGLYNINAISSWLSYCGIAFDIVVSTEVRGLKRASLSI